MRADDPLDAPRRPGEESPQSWPAFRLPPFPIRGLFTPEREEACVAEGRYGVPDAEAASAWLDRRHRRRGAGWVEVVHTGTGPWLRAALWLAGGRHPAVCVEAVSREALARVEEELRDAFEDVKIRDTGARGFGFARTSFGWTSDRPVHSAKARQHRPVPGVEEQLETLVADEERRWLDAPNPLLDDQSPREAIRDPDWVAAVYELLAWIERCYFSGPDERIGLTAAFNPHRLRLALGIGRAWTEPWRGPPQPGQGPPEPGWGTPEPGRGPPQPRWGPPEPDNIPF